MHSINPPRLLVLALAIALISASTGLPFGPSNQAHASPNCNTGRPSGFGYHWAGSVRSDSYVGGVYAYIENYNRPYVDPSAAPVTMWSMLDNAGAQGQRYAQIGWWEDTGQNRYLFTEYTNNTWTGSHWAYQQQIYWNINPLNGFSYYSVYHDNTPGYFTMLYNGQPIALGQAFFSPTEAQILGETHSLKSQMPGGYGGTNGANHAQVTYANVWVGGGWQPFAGQPVDEGGLWGLQGWSTTAFDIWDKACSS